MSKLAIKWFIMCSLNTVQDLLKDASKRSIPFHKPGELFIRIPNFFGGNFQVNTKMQLRGLLLEQSSKTNFTDTPFVGD